MATVQRVSDSDTLIAVTSNQTMFRNRPLGIDTLEIAHSTIPCLHCSE